MTLLFMDGFDAKDVASKWGTSTYGSPGAPTFGAATRFGAGYAVTLPDSVSTTTIGITRSIPATAHVYVGAALKLEGVLALQTYTVPFHGLAGDSGATWHLYLVATASGAIQLWRGDVRPTPLAYNTVFTPAGTMIAASAGGVIDTNWRYVELGATIASSGGTAVVKVDGNTVINFTGNTRNGGTGTSIDLVAIAFGLNAFAAKAVGAPSVDDVYICDGLGSANNSFLGEVRVQTQFPNGAGSSTQFTPTGSGTNYLNVNEIPDNQATFNADSISGHRDTYAIGSLAAGTGTVYAVQQVMSANKAGAGSASLKAAQKSGATVSYGATQSLGTTFTTYRDVFETNPATGVAYTASGVNALEIGAEVV